MEKLIIKLESNEVSACVVNLEKITYICQTVNMHVVMIVVKLWTMMIDVAGGDEVSCNNNDDEDEVAD